MSTVPIEPQIADSPEREAALRTSDSCLVQAPAGSGKTELLTQRYLALLATVEEPEQVLAITFTRKATAEMRARVLKELEKAAKPPAEDMTEHEQRGRALAEAVLAHSDAPGWQLLEQPQRLNLQTIDALALSIAYQMPLLSRLGGQLTPIDDATALYTEAAERTLSHLGGDDPALDNALRTMLALRDASLADCEALIARMLERREQWLLLLPGALSSQADPEQLRGWLEAPFRREHDAMLAALRASFAPHSERVEDLLRLAAIACPNDQPHLALLADIAGLHGLLDGDQWRCFATLLLTQEDCWRSVTWPIGLSKKQHPQESERLLAHIRELQRDSNRLTLLCRLRKLPPRAYTEAEWRIVRSIFVVLRRAVAELRVLFAEREVIDFPEAGIGAHTALEEPSVLMRLDSRVRHLLVDEFQDTSRPQFGLLRQLMQDWEPGDGRTVFLVGDPMQSIYLFRDAESRLFQQVRQHGIEIGGARERLTDLQLSTNFRSTPATVRELNAIFTPVLTGEAEDDVLYAPAVAAKDGDPDEAAVHMHARTCDPDADDRDAVDAAEADELLSIIRAHLPAAEQARREDRKYRIAVLARSRPHLTHILERLRGEGIPFRGVKLDLLRNRQEILDLLSLLRAMLHPADVIAWLAVLRAPWCGLTLPALHAVHGDLDGALRDRPVAALLRERLPLLSDEDRQRALHVLSALDAAAAAYASGALSASPAALALWLERTWHALGAPRYLDPEARANTEAFFRMLAEMPPHSLGTLEASFQRRLEKLYAEPDPNASEMTGVQVMTIHSAKGLEFEVVLVPALHKSGKPDDPPLFQWLVRERDGTQEEELLLAPIGAKLGEGPALFKYVGEMVKQRQRQEEKRLLYVACSRAVREVHLFATVERRANGELCKPAKGTLLRAGWDGLADRVRDALAATEATPARNNLMTMPSAQNGSHGVVTNMAAGAAPRQVLHRLPADALTVRDLSDAHSAPAHGGSAYAWQAAGRLARVQGVVLHALLERAAQGTSGAHPDWSRLARLLLRQQGLSSSEQSEALRVVTAAIERTLGDAHGRWLLDPQHRSWNELMWTAPGEDAGRFVRQRPDRVFLAGATPGETGADYLWIVDYKTAAPEPGEDRQAFVAEAREQYREQLDRYSLLLREALAAEGTTVREHRLALYHPLLPWLDWWAG